METIRVALDAMGGDHGPVVTVPGAVAASRELPGVEVILVGDETALRAELAKTGADLRVVHAAQVVAMDEAPANAVRSRRDNSMSVACRLVKQGEAQAFVTAGNTGAALAAALFDIGRVRGIRRPALGVTLPSLGGQYLLLDIGANAECKPQDLVQFGLMGHVYASRVMGVAHPRLGLISNGEEAGKGNELVKEAYGLLKESGLNFVGNVEGKDLPHDHVDVAITDGFTGNVLLKTAEGMATLILETIRSSAKSSLRGKIGGALLRPILRQALAKLDYTEVGGAPLLGIDGVAVVGHGRSNERAIVSLIRAGAHSARQGLPQAIADGLQELRLREDQTA
ncbi:MAG: phosphate acyltransferase PlsX [Anaerolineae bacterium]